MVGFAYGIRADFAIWSSVVELNMLHARYINAAVDDGVGGMNSPRTELSGQRLRQGALRRLAYRDVGKSRSTSERRCRASDYQSWRVGRALHRLEQQRQCLLSKIEETTTREVPLETHQHE